MIKATLLLCLLTIGTFQQSLDSQVTASPGNIDISSIGGAPGTGGSGSGNLVRDRPREGGQLVDENGNPISNPIRQSTQPSTSAQTSQAPSTQDTITDWTFIQGQKSELTGTAWKLPGQSFQLYPVGYQTSFTITFNTDCPHKPVKLTFAACGYAFVYVNGQLVQTWLPPYPSYHNVTLAQPHLKCGCNTIKILVYNFCCPTPAAITYTLSQDVTGCYDCNNTGVTHYNRQTCQCECVEECACKNPLRQWSGYPSCGCKCREGPKTCPSGQFWDWGKCACSCPRKCCPDGYQQSSTTCGCVKICQVKQCTWPKIWDSNICDCKCSNPQQCTSPQQWSEDSCSCKCPKVLTCPAGQVWDSSTCSCKCQQQQCNRPYVWSPTSCSCICQRYQCNSGQQWDWPSCSCKNVGCVPRSCPYPYTFDYNRCDCVCSVCPPGGLPTSPTGRQPLTEGSTRTTEGNTGQSGGAAAPPAGQSGGAGGMMTLDSDIKVGN